MRSARLVISLIALLTVGAQSPPDRYSEGQVWEYKTRPGDEGSLLKIQSIENIPALAASGPVYHISVIGFHFGNPRMASVLPHAPVSHQTLDASVTKLSSSTASFPDAAAGIAEWRNARGGVFTISVAEIVALLDRQTAHTGDQPVPSL